jgi:phosphoenolpyruvate-protein kinase (PTS system EI component)
MSRTVFRGVPASGGVAAGTAVVLHPPGLDDAASAADPFDPVRASLAVEQALDQVGEELAALTEKLRSSGHAAEADIVEVGALIASDPVLRADAREAVVEGLAPARAVVKAADRHAAAMEALSEPTLRERAADIRQVGRRAAAILGGTSGPPGHGVEGPLVLVAEELGPADVLGLLDGAYAAAAATLGGPSSHAAIVARALRLPLVLGLPPEVLSIAPNTEVVVDGDAGTLVANPQDQELDGARTTMATIANRRSALASERGLSAATTDGVEVQLLCNVASAAEARAGVEAAADGVGLLRTELPFLEATEWPDEAAHYDMLLPILQAVDGREAVVRVLDFGGDKVPLFLAEEVHGASRGLPSLLSAPDALGAQIRAALRAGRDTGAKLKILIPMVTSLRELELARRILDSAALEVGVPPSPLGVMVEVPSAALLADRLAKEADFLSIGTNDLTQHALGVSRADPSALPALAAHPSILSLIGRVAKAGRANGKSVRVCGEAGADALVVPLLIGLGIEALSVAPSRVDETRARVRRLSFADCREVARKAVGLSSIDDVWELVRNRVFPDVP